MSFSIRPYHDDARACAEVYFHAVQRGTHEKYTEAQRNAWAPKSPTPSPIWPMKLASLPKQMAR